LRSAARVGSYAQAMSVTQQRPQPPRLSGALAEITAQLVRQQSPGPVLDLILRAGGELLGTAAAGVLISSPGGGLGVVAASDETAQFVELLQAHAGRGPCVDCIHTGQMVAAADLQADHRWPDFTATALSAGYRAVHAVPMLLGQDTIGGLNLFYDSVTQLPTEAVEMARILADLASLALSQEHDTRRADRFTETALSTLNDRLMIDQAVGMIAGATGIAPERARAELTEYATAQHRPLREIARALTDRTLNPTTIKALT
jgi:GAF domain-containing protein